MIVTLPDGGADGVRWGILSVGPPGRGVSRRRKDRRMDSPTLPEAIVAPVDTFVRDLVTWAAAHRDSSLADLETHVLEQLRLLAPALVGGLITVTQRSLDPRLQRDRPSCPACDRLGRLRGYRTRQMKTTCGTVAWERPWAQCPGCGHTWSPTDQTLGVAAQQRMSTPLHQWVVELGASLPFAEATALLRQLTGLTVGTETLRTKTEAEGAARNVAQQVDTAQVLRTRAAVEPVDAAPHQLVIEMDGVMVRYRDGWHEVKIGVFGGWDRTVSREDQRLLAPSYLAAREPSDLFAQRWGAEGARRGALQEVAHDGPVTGPGLTTLRSVVVLADGARWIWNAAAEQFGDRIEIVDWYHATEHVWAVAHAVFGDEAEAKAWGKTQVSVLYDHGVDALLDRLRDLHPSTDQARAVLATERGYFQSNRARMQYPTFRAEHLPIGSGAVESSAKHLVQLRMKRAGARWSEVGAQSVVVLRAQILTQRAHDQAA